MDVLERETDLAVKCEPERCGLEELEEQQDQLEVMVRGQGSGVTGGGEITHQRRQI